MKRLFPPGIAILLLTACGGSHEVAVRPTASLLAAGAHSAEYRVAEANGHLLLGNVALALEGFRRASREDPASTAALIGMARCYDLMGRGDLSRPTFERALALQPRDRTILAAFAASLSSAGLTGEAARVRREQAAQGGTIPRAGPSLDDSVLAVTRDNTSVLTAGGVPVPAAPIAAIDRGEASPSGPRLERTGVGEMVLVTSRASHWKPLALLAASNPPKRASRPTSAAARFPVRITILNAGSGEGTAARTRTRLQQLGWSGIAIANAGRALERTELLYPAALAGEGEQLARQLRVPVKARQTETLDRIVLRIGRDLPADRRI